MKDLSDRLKEFIDYSRRFKSIRDFERKIGWSYTTVNNLNDNLVTDKQIDLKNKVPELNLDWLLTGKGEMINVNKEFVNDVKATYSDNGGEVIKNKNGLEYYKDLDGNLTLTVPLIPFPAYASFIEVSNDEYTKFEEFQTVVFSVDHIGRGKYLGFKVTNDSMDYDGRGYTPSGAVVLARELQKQHWKNGFNQSKFGFILITHKAIMFKDIIGNIDNEGNILLHSRNPSPEYHDFKFPINEVHSIYKVIKRTF